MHPPTDETHRMIGMPSVCKALDLPARAIRLLAGIDDNPALRGGQQSYLRHRIATLSVPFPPPVETAPALWDASDLIAMRASLRYLMHWQLTAADRWMLRKMQGPMWLRYVVAPATWNSQQLRRVIDGTKRKTGNKTPSPLDP